MFKMFGKSRSLLGDRSDFKNPPPFNESPERQKSQLKKLGVGESKVKGQRKSGTAVINFRGSAHLPSNASVGKNIGQRKLIPYGPPTTDNSLGPKSCFSGEKHTPANCDIPPREKIPTSIEKRRQSSTSLK